MSKNDLNFPWGGSRAFLRDVDVTMIYTSQIRVMSRTPRTRRQQDEVLRISKLTMEVLKGRQF